MEDAIKTANARGVLINSLFQLDDINWRCSIRAKAEPVFEYGDGLSPKEAIENALERAKGRIKFAEVKEDFSDILG